MHRKSVLRLVRRVGQAPGFAESNLASLPPEAGTDFWFSPSVARGRQGTRSRFILLDTSGSKLPNTGYLSFLPGQRLARPRTFSHFIILPFGPLPRVNTGQTRFCSGVKRGLVPFYRAPHNPLREATSFPFAKRRIGGAINTQIALEDRRSFAIQGTVGRTEAGFGLTRLVASGH